MPVYLWLKAFHIAAAMIWISGMLVIALSLTSGPVRAGPEAAQDTRTIDTIRRWDRCVTFPAMLLVWCLGIAMAMQADWFSSPWLMMKLAVVAALAAVHGVLSGQLRRFDPGADQPSILLYAAYATILCVVIIAILAVTKPF